MPVELRWDGKYDAEGRKTAPLRVALLFQTVETINESVQERQRGLEADSSKDHTLGGVDDYWAIDFDFRGDTFHNQWQSYRTRKNKKLDLTAKHIYDEVGTYTVQVKVIDILGNDTTRTLKVEVK